MSDLEPGTLVSDRYRLDRILGEGGMGVVWAATHNVTRKPVALKFVKRAADAEMQRARVLREARASCAVRHPNIVEVHDILEGEDGMPIMVMEYLVGDSFAHRLGRGTKMPVDELAGIMLPVVSAVGAAHALGIVHRDLKPENIFLLEGPPKTVKVLDFGIAKLTAPEGDAAATGALTATGALLGTPFYMAPEQAFGEKDIDSRADTWALGLILYQALSGVLPTEADNVGQIFKNIVARPIRPLEEIAPEVPADIAAIVGRMLSRSRKSRPRDLHEVAEVLARHTDVEVPMFGSPSSFKTPSSRDEGPAADTEAATLIDPIAETIEAPSKDTPGVPAASRSLARSGAEKRGLGLPLFAVAVLIVTAAGSAVWFARAPAPAISALPNSAPLGSTPAAAAATSPPASASGALSTAVAPTPSAVEAVATAAATASSAPSATAAPVVRPAGKPVAPAPAGTTRPKADGPAPVPVQKDW